MRGSRVGQIVGAVLAVAGGLYCLMAWDSVALRWLGFGAVLLGAGLYRLCASFSLDDEDWLASNGVDPER